MPGAAVAIGLGVAAGTAGGAAIAAHKQSNATRDATKMQVDANTSAAQIQSASAAEELAFKRRQAEIDWQNQQQTARANYDQWRAREGRLSSLGVMTGLAPRNIPDFQPGIDPGFDTGATPPPTAGPAGATASGDPIEAALLKNYTDLGVKPTGPGSGPTDIAYFRQKVNETGGLTPDNVKYWFGPSGRIATELAQARGGGAKATPYAQPRVAPVSFASLAYAPQTAAPILAPGVTGMEMEPYARRPYSFADMVR